MAGFVKDLSVGASDTRAQRLQLPAQRRGADRYLAHLEARLDHQILTLVVCSISYDVTFVLDGLMESEAEPTSDKVLVFRDWHTWWSEYHMLQNTYQFRFRMNRLINVVCKAVNQIASGEDASVVRQDLEQKLQQLIEENPDRLTMCAIASAFRYKLLRDRTEF